MATTITWDDWLEWLYGLGKVAIAGGASSVVSAYATSGVLPTAAPVGSAAFYHIMWLTFCFHFAIHGFTYLQQSPLPKLTKVESSVKRISVEPGTGAIVEESIKKTGTEPAAAIEGAGKPTANPTQSNSKKESF